MTGAHRHVFIKECLRILNFALSHWIAGASDALGCKRSAPLLARGFAPEAALSVTVEVLDCHAGCQTIRGYTEGHSRRTSGVFAMRPICERVPIEMREHKRVLPRPKLDDEPIPSLRNFDLAKKIVRIGSGLCPGRQRR